MSDDDLYLGWDDEREAITPGQWIGTPRTGVLQSPGEVAAGRAHAEVAELRERVQMLERVVGRLARRVVHCAGCGSGHYAGALCGCTPTPEEPEL